MTMYLKLLVDCHTSLDLYIDGNLLSYIQLKIDIKIVFVSAQNNKVEKFKIKH